MIFRRAIASLGSAALLAPSLTLASSTTDLISQLAGLWYLVIGFALIASILLMIGGLIMWVARLGTFPTHRDRAIVVMEWGVATLFTLVLVLGIVEFIQSHTAVVLYVIVLVVVGLLLWLVLTSTGGGDGEEHEEGGEH